MKNVTIIGAGALGSHVVQFLRGEAKLRVIDFDRIEAKNVLAQFHGKSHIGKSKVEALKQTMNFLWNVKVDTIPHKLVQNNADALLGGWDLIIDTLDNGEARRIVQAYVRAHNTPCLHGALAADGAFGRVIWDAQFVIDEEDSQGAPTCEGGEHLPYIGIVSAYLARAAQVFLRHGKKIGFSISPTNVIQV